MRVGVIKTTSSLDKNIVTLLKRTNIPYQIITRNTLAVYSQFDFIIFSTDSEVSNLFGLMEKTLLYEVSSVLFVYKGYHNYHSLEDYRNFVSIDINISELHLTKQLKYHYKMAKHIDYLVDQNNKLESKLKTKMLVEKAKRILIEQGLTEEEAYNYIRVRAMENRTTKKNVAQTILITYKK